MSSKSNFIHHLILAALGYVLLILGHGYVFGHLGTMETFPYVKELIDPSLYPNDFYIDGIQSRFPDVRWIFVQILYYLGITGPWSAFIAHMAVSILLILGLLKVTFIFTKNGPTAFWVSMTTLLILYNHNLGGNELYYNSLAPSLLAKSIGVWSIYYFLKKQFRWATLLLISATFIHPMAGIQLFLVGSLAAAIQALQKTGWKLSTWTSFRRIRSRHTRSIFTYLLMAGTWIVLLQKSFSDAPITTDDLFSILFFRLGHHYFPSEYPMNDYLLLIPFFLFGWYFWKRNLFMFWFYSLAFIGMLIYTIGVEILEMPIILSAQWFKTTIWLKFFSSIALFVFIEERLFPKITFLRKLYTPMTIIFFLGIGTFLLLKLPQRHPTTLDLPWRGAYNDQIKIAQLAKIHTPKDAVFITPTDFTHLKYYGERSTYVDYKATIHFHSKLEEWYQRINQIYKSPNADINSMLQLTGHTLILRNDYTDYKQLGITHIIVKSKTSQKGTKGFVAEVGKFYILEL